MVAQESTRMKHEHDTAGAAHATHDHDHPHGADACCTPAPLVSAVPQAGDIGGAGTRSAIRILQMDCPTEETLIRNKLQAMESVHGMEFNLMQRVLTVAHRPDALQPILAAIRTLGFDPQPVRDTVQAAPAPEHKPWWPLALAGAAALAAEAVHWLGGAEWIAAALALGAIAICGLGTYKKGVIALRNGNLNINALMSIAVTGAMVLQQWPEAAMVMVLFTVAELIEARSLDRARNAIQGLMQLAPEQATVQRDDGRWEVVAAAAVAPGALVRVRPGERIALDGHLVSGRTSIDQAPITGESLPVDKGP
ncbi:MAG: heavy metal translocating P-type ATPase, partial [Rhodoferax sp.]|nr:heavy metal translocating P-type ATPase [Rhodoferax sp.]